MEKKWYESKAMIGGVLVICGAVVTALGQLFSGNLDFNSFVSQVIPLLGTGLGIIGVRTKLG